MRDFKDTLAMILLTGTVVWGAACAPVVGQVVSQRGINSRGINPIGSQSVMQRRPVPTRAAGPLMNQATSSGNVNTGGPLNMGYVPIYNGSAFFLDPSLSSSATGDISQSGMPATGSRPNIRPRLNIADPDAMKSAGDLQTIRNAVLKQIAQCTEKPFSGEWYAAHAVVVPGPHEGGTAWSGSSWVEVQEWIGLDAEPQRFDFRPDDQGLIFVYRNEVREGRAVDARKLATQLASTSSATEDETPGRSLGVFAAVSPVDEPVATLFHLIVGQSGAVSGYQYDFATDSVQPLQGAVDPASQRTAWQAGNSVVEAGLKNLTEDVARALVFRDDGWTQSWILMRIPESSK